LTAHPLTLKLASREIFALPGSAAFFQHSQVRTASRKNVLGYDAGASGSLVGEYDGAGNLIQETVWLSDIPVATLRPSGSSIAVYYVVTDQLNTPRQIIRPSDNALMWTWFSGPFGVEAPNEDPQGLGTFVYDLRLPGQIAGSWGSTYQNGARDLDPAVGRFMESDPLGLAGGSYSTYAYAGGNPVSNSDPDGSQEVLPTPAGPIPVPVFPGSENQQWDQARDAEAIAMQEAAENAVLALINGAKKAAQAVHNVCSAVSHEQEEDKNCEALYQSTLQTCASLKGRKRFACFEAARENREQCYQEKGKTAPSL
jgi:RHS repeat-associated protein